MQFPPQSADTPAVAGVSSRTTRRQHSPPDPDNHCHNRTKAEFLYRGVITVMIATLIMIGLLPQSRANAQDDPVIAPGDAVITGFSGYQPNGALLIPGMNPLDQFFINIEGPSAQIQSLSILGEPPQGQLVAPGLRKQILAKDVGQVFPITIMDAKTSDAPPAILLGATSMFGLHIVKPDSNGDGVPERIEVGEAGATWMPGMFADDKGGSPGAIWRVDGTTGDVALFATIPNNSGPGLGGVVFDKKTRQVFVSDLDTGLIHRLDEDGQLIDTFDHGVDGRPAKGLASVSDDGAKANIESPAFDIEKPETWGLTPVERRVHGMAVHQDRLYYAADHMIWSIGIDESGRFGGDARWELDIDATSPDTQLSDMLFDAQGRMYVAERAAQRGSYDFSHFAEPEKAEVKRYRLEDPDDPATESRWIADPETYAIGLPAEHRHSNGGITLGFPYDETGMIKTGSCGEFLWTTGERLRAGEFAQGDGEGDPAANADVHGLQGNPISLVRPENVPPMTSYFTDYDSFFGDAEKAGHMGDVEIWQPCDAQPQTFGELPPWWGDIPEETPEDYPETFPDPDPDHETNLELTKRAIPGSCWSWGSDWMCRYSIRIRNTGPDDYFGDLQIRDTFPANPAGLDTFFQPQPPWFCWQPGGNPAETRCWRPNVFLASGQSTFMTVWAKVPKNPTRCHLTNVAEIEWAPGGTQWNTDPTDDLDAATAIIPDPDCKDDDRESNLRLEKKAEQCKIVGSDVVCGFHITVENTGPGNYLGPISVRDQMSNGATFQWAPGFNWNCANVVGNTFECTHKNPANVFLAPWHKVHLWVYGKVPVDQAKEYACKLPNRAIISNPLGAPDNTDPTDDADSATAQMPEELCREDETNLRLEKAASPDMCSLSPANGDFYCRYTIRVINDGPGVYNGNLHVLDTTPAGTTLNLGPGPWNCDPQVGNTRLCKLNGVVMGPVTARSFPVWLRVPRAVARDTNCQIRNVAKIVVAPGGTPMNTNAADDEDDAVSTIPGEACDDLKPETNLKITKRATPEMCVRTGDGFKCDWTIVVENTGPDAFNGSIVLNETLPGEPLNASWNAPWNCVGAGGGGGAICTHPNAAIDLGGGVQLNLTTFFSLDLVKQSQCKLTNLAEIAQPAGSTPENTDASDDTAQATASVDAEVCQTYPPPQPPEPPQCPPGYIYDDGQCVPKGGECPRGWSKTPVRGKCCPPAKPWNGRQCEGDEPPGIIYPIPPPPPPPEIDCPRGMKEVSSTRAHFLRRQGWTVRRYRGLWCVKPPVETQCPAGYEEVPRSRIDVLRDKGWTITRVDRGKWCGKEPAVQSCPSGMTRVPRASVPSRMRAGWRLLRLRNGQWCGKPGKQCPPRTHLDDGECVPDRVRECNPPLVGKWPNCRRPNPVCGDKCQCERKGRIWKNGRCFTGFQCWNGNVVASRAACPPQPCGRGFTGYKPNCKPIPNPAEECKKKGGRWFRGRCVIRQVTCWDGSKAPSRRQCPPRRQPCPPGTVGKYKPHCKVIRKPCPPGTIGKFQPNCRKIVRKPCPRGTIGKFQPNCRVIKQPVKPRHLKSGQKFNLR